MKKLTLSLIAAGLTTASLGASASLATGAAPFQVVVPNLKPGVEFTLEGMYLQPTSSNLNYGWTGASTRDGANNPTTGSYDTVAATNTNTSVLKPKYNLGYGVAIGYVFPDSGNDVQVHWQHFDHGTTASTQGPVNYTLSNEGNFSGNDFTGTATKSADVTFKLDSIDLDVGQYISMGTRLQTRMFGGLRAVQLQQNTTYSGSEAGYVTVSGRPVSGSNAMPVPVELDVDRTGQYSITETSKFKGIGPRLGFETNYNVSNGFGVTGMLAGSLLVGNVETTGPVGYNNTQISAPYYKGGETVTNNNIDTTNVSVNDQRRVVPALDAKLGANYTFGMGATSNATLEAGYKVTQYFGVFDNAGYNGGLATSNKNVGFNGPYLSLNMKL